MSLDPACARLAELHGIALDYHDIRGRRHRVSERTVRALLAAMGVDALTAQAAEQALRDVLRRRWSAVLPPAIVVRVDACPWRVALQLPSARASAPLRWRIDGEDGQRIEMPVDSATLVETGRGTGEDGERIACDAVLDVDLPAGYHRLTVLSADTSLGECLLVAAPPACYRPLALEQGGRVWGAAVQVYALRSERNWGIGDFTDLRRLLEHWGTRGAAIVATNPLHALFPHDPARASPYGPSSRLWKHWLYLDVEAIDDYRECEEARSLVRSAPFQERLAALRRSELVDHPGVAEAKRTVLERLYGHFRTGHLATGSPRARAFRAFQSEGGTALRGHALFEALQERFHAEDPSVWGWPAWPQAWRDPASPLVARFAAEHLEQIEFYEYLQWQADLQLGAAGRRSFELALGIGLCEDLAVSVDGGGSEAWANAGLYARGASVGAPPDDFSPAGQDWGLPPLVPERLRTGAYAAFVATLRANMRHGGAVRIDHVMGLARLFWVPHGATAAEGAYVHYPFADLLGILALESQRNRCLVIGEDLGTVPDDLRSSLHAAEVLSYRLLYFERAADGACKAPGDYPATAIAAISTHDLPTLAGWWAGHDLDLRASLGLFATQAEREAAIVERARDRAHLLLALEREGLLPSGATPNPVSVPAMTADLALAVHTYLARTAAQVVVVRPEDVLGEREPVNVPGTVDQHPNWRRKLALGLEAFVDDERFIDLAAMFTRERGAGRPAPALVQRPEQVVIPRATYRLHLHRGFTFADATALVPYLAALGVSHVYCSPCLRARPGSSHGYDIVDHGTLNPEIGNRDDLDRFVAALRAHGMGQIMDVVPNHMGVMGADNAWWMDVLQHGPASACAGYFDIDWYPVGSDLAGRLLVPVLGDHYGAALVRGELVLAYEPDTGCFVVGYFGHRFPIDPREVPRILARVLRSLGAGELPAEATVELESLLAALSHLPERSAAEAEAVAERARDTRVLQARLCRLVREHPALAQAVDRAVRVLNGEPGRAGSFDALHELLEAQAYRLAHWRVAGDEINYRRFFDVNDLAALRMEEESVFAATHALTLELVAQGAVDGLRIDHPDGLYDPARYFQRLQERCARPGDAPAAGRKPGVPERPLWVVVEKILAGHEHLPQSWAVHGTTGYRFAAVVNGLFVDRRARSRLDRCWRAFAGDEAIAFEEAAYAGRRTVMRGALAGELSVLAGRLLRLARADRRTRDHTLNSLREAVAEVVACFPVYRTYVGERASAQDRRFIDWAVARAKRRSRLADPSVFEFVRSVLLAQPPAEAPPERAQAYRAAALRMQQFTAPVMAKGVEDTALYVCNRLLSLNDVGSDPESFGMGVAAFHAASADRAKKWPHTMLATSTHDSKRSEDVRARLHVLSEMPAAWRLAVRRWSRINRSRKRKSDAGEAPSRNDEYFLYQTLVGTFPSGEIDGAVLAAYRERIERYAIKAAREAKRHTSWVNPDAGYEAALTGFLQALLGRLDGNLFLDDLRSQIGVYAWLGALNGIAAALVKIASPGVPDIYQGCELVDLSLVDPDNRRPVDYALRARRLAELQTLASGPAEALASGVRGLFDVPDDGLLKLWVLWRALGLRRERPDVFTHGNYRAVAVEGARADHVVAFERRHGDAGAVMVTGRLFAGLGAPAGTLPTGEAAWGDTVLDLGFLPLGVELLDVLTGQRHSAQQRVALAHVCSTLPFALLSYGEPPG